MHILQNLGKPELATAARVCRAWTDVALGMLWEELESVHPIMALLEPIKRIENGWTWENGFPSGNWTRFTSYAKRVRSLSYCASIESGDNRFSDRMCSQVPAKWLCYVASHHGRYLLPEIRRIDWNCCEDDQLEMIIPFISPKINDVRIRALWDVSPRAMDGLLRALRILLPSGVRVFHFISHETEPEEGTSDIIKSLIERLDQLHELRLPSQRVAPFMFKSNNLRVLEAKCNFESEHLRILFRKGSSITFSIIRPLIRCSKLRTLDIEYSKTFDLDATEIREMGGAWRELEALHVASRRTSNASGDPSFGMPLSSLVAFADSFSPKLRKLGLYIDTQDIPAPPDPPISFPHLEIICVGTSELSNDKAFAFLSAVLPAGVGVTTSDHWTWDSNWSVFDPASRGWGGESWNILTRMLAQGESADILAELDQIVDPWDVATGFVEWPGAVEWVGEPVGDGGSGWGATGWNAWGSVEQGGWGATEQDPAWQNCMYLVKPDFKQFVNVDCLERSRG
ncbi:hypothetical protein FS837_009219 [Tulasnella sp. UAMH 9824]|nr:hypothetical protein FS837_009219 [Tulasnella sp. UAMH 9824]